MKLSSNLALFATTSLISAVSSQQVFCVINDEPITSVDLDTGVCNFNIPANARVTFDFVSENDYDAEWYYATVKDQRYSTDIKNKGRVILVPARVLYNDKVPLHHVHLEKQPASNSTEALRKRFLKEIRLVKKDEADDWLASVENTDGEEIDTTIAVVDIDEAPSYAPSSEEPTPSSSEEPAASSEEPTSSEEPISSEERTSSEEPTSSGEASAASSEEPSSTEEPSESSEEPDSSGEESSGIESSGESPSSAESSAEPSAESTTESFEFPSGSESGSNEEVPSTAESSESEQPSASTESGSSEASGTAEFTSSGEVSESASSTGPQSTVTNEETAIITVTSCHNDICEGTTVSATLGPVTTTVGGTTTIYTTYCPISSYESVEPSKVITITTCTHDSCHETTVEATPSTTTGSLHGIVTEYVTYCPITTGGKTDTTTGTGTETSEHIITATVCHNDVCEGTTIPGSKTVVTTTGPGGETSVYTSYCPPSSVETVESSKDITIYACDKTTCHPTTVGATPSTTETVVGGTTSEYVTYCPVTSTLPGGETIVTGTVSSGVTYVPRPSVVTSAGSTHSTETLVSVPGITSTSKVVTATVCDNDVCHETTVPGTTSVVTTTGPEGKTSIYTTFCPVSSVETVESSKYISVYACNSNNCQITTVGATPFTVSTEIEGSTSVYVTYCPTSSVIASGQTIVSKIVSSGTTYVPKPTVVTSAGSTHVTETLVNIPSTITASSSSSSAVVTATVCENDLCHPTTVPATSAVITTTANGETTIVTTYGPASSVETVQSSKDITVYACNDKTCYVGTVGATPSTTATVIEGTTSEYVTYCPTTSVLTGGETIVTGAVTSSSAIYVPKPTVVTSSGKAHTTTSLVSVSGAKPTTATAPATEVTSTSTGKEQGSISAVVSVTVCSNDVCHPSTVPATLSGVTTTVGGSTTVYSSYFPASSVETVESSKVVTVVACSGDQCFATTAVATPEVGTTVVEGTTSEYVTYKASATGSHVFVSSVVTSGGVPYVPQTTVITTGKSSETSVSYVSVSVGTEYQAATAKSSEQVIPVTACTGAVCHGTTVAAVSTAVTTTVNGVESTYSTVQPVSSIETVESSKVIPVVACSSDNCYATSVVATPQVTTTVIEGYTSEYVTYCPTSTSPAASGGESIATEVITSEGVTYVPQSTLVTSGESSYVSTNYVSVSIATPQTTLVAQSSPASTTPSAAISTYEAGASSSRGSMLALALIPLAYFI
ncbi:hypothetical protein Cantr_04373 [Candida viswanathii]|uniref:Uncharacterized protein n=1 Tax=Candida viswanathii TaxID=5486 RepID=A0A367XLA6_9ASCO|nr:hypothetical protein Cantr_04373 [Candida viswanathii]